MTAVMRWRGLFLPALLASMAGTLLGCEQRAAREFAVTVVDAAEIECVGVSNSPGFEQDTMDTLAKNYAKAYKQEHEGEPLTPVGRRLWVNELDHRIEAWFETRTGQAAVDDSGFDSPLVVYGGDPQEGFIEGSYTDTVNTDDVYEEIGRKLCGPRTSVTGTLSVTDADGISGRIRWTEFRYVDSVRSACDGWFTCARDIKLEGLEVE
jgi:hypothetical protein